MSFPSDQRAFDHASVDADTLTTRGLPTVASFPANRGIIFFFLLCHQLVGGAGVGKGLRLLRKIQCYPDSCNTTRETLVKIDATQFHPHVPFGWVLRFPPPPSGGMGVGGKERAAVLNALNAQVM